MTLLLIPAGKGWYGEIGDQKEINIAEPFYLGKYEVTQAEWERVMETSPWKRSPNVKKGSQYPATCMDWKDSKEFCRKMGVQDGCTYRLPSGKEWEYACRAGTRTAFSFGNSESELEPVMHY